MVKAAQAAAAGAANGGNTEIGKVVKVTGATAAKGGDATSVNGIASGIKGIVTAAEKAGKEGKLESEEVAGAGEANADAGKLFAKKKANDGGGDAAAAEKAGKEGKLESEEVAGAGDGNEDAGKLFAKKKNDAANGGGDAAAAEKAAAAVSAVSGKQILKAIVDAAEKAGAGVEDVKDAKNPIDAAIGSTGKNKNAAAFDKMKKNDQIAAAIVLRGMAKDGEFALKNNANNAEKGLKSTVESAVNNTVSGWLEEMVKAAQTAATAASGGKEDMIGKVVKVNAAAAKGGEEKSVNGIAGGIKGIVEAAEKAGEEGKLKSEAAGEANADAGKLFATKKKADEADGGGAGDAEKAAAAVSAVSGKQILKAIVDAAGKAGEKKGVDDVKDAKNPIDAAIGSTKDNKTAAAFNKMKKNDQIAAAIVLRGMAKDGEFALKNAEHANAEKGLKSTVESAVNKTVSGWLEEMVKAATEAATAASGGNTEMIGKVVKVNAAAAKGGEEKSVNGIASGIKGIVEAAEKAGEEGKLESEAAGEANADAGKLFAKKNDAANGGGGAADTEKAAAAVSAVSGKQILKAIVDAAGKEEKKGVADVKDATNPIDAAIGSTGENKNAAAFDKDGMKKNDQIAAAIVLRGMAKDGEFALKNADADKAEKGLKSTVESAVNKTVSGWLEEMVKAAQTAAGAANGDNTEIGKVVKVTGGAAAAKGGEEKSVNGIAGGIKGIVAAAEKAGEEGKLESEAAAGAGEDNAEAGKLFATKKKADEADGGGAADAEKAAAAVSAVSGKQILKAIVDAAGKAGEKKGVDDVKEATNPIDAAIGSTKDNKTAAAFSQMKKNDQIAAAIVLRGMAKDGEFALKNDDADNAEKGLKSTVESAVNKTVSGWLEEMAKAATEAATAASGGKEEMIGKVVKVNAAAAKGGDATSVNGIASGIKGIVEAAEKAGEEGKLKSEAAAAGEANADAGKLFAKKNDDGDNGGGGAADAEKAAAAVSAVSGKQILKAIVDAAKGEEKKGVADVKDATNPIDAAIGSTGENKNAAAAFDKDGMKKNDQIAAAIVLRGMAKDGEFALKNDAADKAKAGLKSTVESAVNKTLCRGMVRRDGKSC